MRQGHLIGWLWETPVLRFVTLWLVQALYVSPWLCVCDLLHVTLWLVFWKLCLCDAVREATRVPL